MAVSLFPWNPPSKIFNLLGTFSLAQACHLFLCKTIQILGYVSLWFKSTFIANHISGNLLRAHLDCDSKITIGWQQDTLVSYSCNDSLGGSQATKAKLNCSSAICFFVCQHRDKWFPTQDRLNERLFAEQVKHEKKNLEINLFYFFVRLMNLNVIVTSIFSQLKVYERLLFLFKKYF